MPIAYSTLQTYLSKIADQGILDADNSGHQRFWLQPYASFISGFIPTKHCGANPVPIVAQEDRTESAFFKILLGTWCNMPQMPKAGPFITDDGYSITLDDGTSISGAQISTDIHDWLAAGALEDEVLLVAKGD
jgi:hypothetical protein